MVTNPQLPRKRLQSAPDQREATTSTKAEVTDHKEEVLQVLEAVEAEVEEDTMMKAPVNRLEIKDHQRSSIKEVQEFRTEIDHPEIFNKEEVAQEAW